MGIAYDEVSRLHREFSRVECDLTAHERLLLLSLQLSGLESGRTIQTSSADLQVRCSFSPAQLATTLKALVVRGVIEVDCLFETHTPTLFKVSLHIENLRFEDARGHKVSKDYDAKGVREAKKKDPTDEHGERIIDIKVYRSTPRGGFGSPQEW